MRWSNPCKEKRKEKRKVERKKGMEVDERTIEGKRKDRTRKESEEWIVEAGSKWK